MVREKSILRLCNPQLPTIVLRRILMVTLNHSWLQNLYFKCLSENFTIAWRASHKRMDLRRQEMQKTISSLLIQRYVTFFHLIPRTFLQGKNPWVVVSVAYLPKLCINIYYNSGIVIWRNPKIKVKMHKPESLVKWAIYYLRHIKLCHATRASYLPNIIQHGNVNNVCISTIVTCIDTLERCVTLLWKFPTHLSSSPRTR